VAGVLASAAILGWLFWSSGCDYSAPEFMSQPGEGPGADGLPPLDPAIPAGAAAPASLVQRGQEERAAILEGSIILIQRAALEPGGENFKEAVKKLNQYFDGTSPGDYLLNPAAREYLKTQLPAAVIKGLENRNWSLRDARHLEDCMMYYGIATRVAGTGESLDRVRRVFDWVVRQIQLVPPGSLRAAQLPHVFARPYDILLRGMATESEGFWAERAWLFMALCRQMGIDTGLVTYSKSTTLEPLVPKNATTIQLETGSPGMRMAPKPPIVWICAVLIDDKAYLFDARLGLEIPGPDGSGVATLDEAIADPVILERMNLPGLTAYGTSRASLLGSRRKIGIMIDSSQGYFSPKMKLLERDLVGKERAILYRDAAEQRDHFVRVLGKRSGGVSLWPLPLEVETRLFTDSQFVASIQSTLFLFRRDFPLVYARVKHLRGEINEAIEDYVKLRFAENPPWASNLKLSPSEVQQIQDGLDVYATYYLALAHLELNNQPMAELMFQKTLELLPEPGPSQPYYNMFRWGANANLGRIYESKHDSPRAIAYRTQRDPTAQYVGNLLSARELIWKDPMIGSVSLAPAPPPRGAPSKPVAARGPSEP
jgi:hypothetical protein